MQYQIKKGSEESQFWIDFMKFRQIWYSAKDDSGKWWDKNSQEWEKLVNSADRLLDKYSKTEFIDMARKLISSYLGWIEKEWHTNVQRGNT